MKIAWYSRDGHLEIMAKTATALRENSAVDNFFVCHNEVEAFRLRSAHGHGAITVLAQSIKEHWPDSELSKEEYDSLSQSYDAIPLARVAWSEIFELSKGEPWATKNLIAHIRFWESFLKSNSIDCLIIEVPSILSTCAAWSVCQGLGVQVISPIDIAPLGNRMVLSESWQGYYPGFSEGADLVPSNERSPEAVEFAQRYLDQIENRPQLTPEVRRRRAAGSYEGLSLRTVIKKLPGFLKRRRAKRQYYLSSGGEYFFRRWAKAMPNLALHKIFRPFQPLGPSSHTKPFFLMPLHEPREWSNYTWMGVRYADVESLIREIAACLPPGYELYIKEHSSGFGLRPFKFYRRVRKIGRVRLINPYADGFQLMKRSAGVITLGSTMGWEAWLLDCPVVLLGEPWYWRLGGIMRARDAQEIAEAVVSAQSYAPPDKETKLAAISGLFDLSFEAVKHPHPKALEDTNVRRWAEAIRARLSI